MGVRSIECVLLLLLLCVYCQFLVGTTQLLAIRLTVVVGWISAPLKCWSTSITAIRDDDDTRVIDIRTPSVDCHGVCYVRQTIANINGTLQYTTMHSSAVVVCFTAFTCCAVYVGLHLCSWFSSHIKFNHILGLYISNPRSFMVVFVFLAVIFTARRTGALFASALYVVVVLFVRPFVCLSFYLFKHVLDRLWCLELCLRERLFLLFYYLPLCTSITPSLFHSRLKTYLFHKSYPRRFASSSRTASTDVCLDRFFWATRFLILVFLIFFVSGPCARLSWPSRQLLSAR